MVRNESELCRLVTIKWGGRASCSRAKAMHGVKNS